MREVAMGHHSGGLPSEFEWFLRILKRLRPDYSNQAKNALKELCQRGQRAGKGFDPKLLAYQLGRPLGAINAERIGRPESPPLRANDLKRIARRARKLQEDVEYLKTSLGFDLFVTGVIPVWPDDALIVLKALATADAPHVMEVVRRRRRRGKKGRDVPGAELPLELLCRYVKKTTSSWNDSLLSAILDPLEVPHTESAQALMVWRKRRGLQEG
jgi:hypothetical protein